MTTNNLLTDAIAESLAGLDSVHGVSVHADRQVVTRVDPLLSSSLLAWFGVVAGVGGEVEVVEVDPDADSVTLRITLPASE